MSYSFDPQTRSSVMSFRLATSLPSHLRAVPPSIYRPSYPPPKMYYDDHDPRIGPAEMPSPQSEYAPYYSGYADTFEDFLDEFEGRAPLDPRAVYVSHRISSARLARVPAIPSRHLRPYHPASPSHEAEVAELCPRLIRRRMECVDDVLQYYRDFLCYSAPLVHAGYLTEEDRDAAFWCGFHPEDRKALQPRLIGKNPIQPPDTPFYFEDVFHCARAAFAYDGASLSWSSEYQFKPPSVRCEQPVAEHVSRDNYGPREVSRAVVSNAETESTHSSSELLSLPTPDPQLPISSSLSTSEQHPHTRSATVDQPENTPTFSIPSSTLFPLSSPSVSESRYILAHSATVDHPEAASTLSFPSSTFLPSTPSVRLTPSTADDDPEHAPTFSDPSFIPLPSTSPAPTRSLAHSVADDVSEIISTPSPMLSIPSDFEYLSPEKEAQPERELVSISSTIPTSLPLLSTSSLSSSQTDDVPEIASTPPPFTSITPACPLTLSILSNFEYLPSETEEEPESEPASMSSTTPSSLPLQSTPFLSSPSDVDVPELASAPPSSLSISSDPECLPSAMEDQPEPESASTLSIPPKLYLPPRVLTHISDHLPASHPSRSTLEISPSSVISTPALPVSLLHDQSSFSSESRRPSELKAASCEVILHTSDANLLLPLEVSLNALVSPHSSSSQQSLGVTSISSDLLETAPAPASPSIPSVPKQVPTAQWLLYLVPQLLKSQEPLLVPEVTSMRTPRLTHSLPPLRMSGFRSAHFDFALIIVTTAVLVFVFPNVLATFLSHARKFGNKNKDLSDRQNSNLKTGNTFAQRLRLQYTQHGKRFVFDPGGLSSSLALESTHENARGRKPKTRGGFVTTHDATLPTLVLVGNRTVFIAETLKFFSRRSLTGDGQDLNPLGGVRPALGLGLKRASRCHIGVTPFPGMPCILPYLF
ncbi:hypothetical protein BJY52DRAFT_1217529 [Lactarius psammicola]|nr:hypothetical protein BJY52DRAFT_1217529 [Lactarius psammicola]